MDDQDESPIPPDDEDRVAAARRRLDEFTRRASQPSSEQATYDKVVRLEANVERLTQVVTTLTRIVTRLADERLGDNDTSIIDGLADTDDD
jgi:hypothetical protein